MSYFQTYFLYYFVVIITSVLVASARGLSQSRFRNFSKPVFWFAMLIPIIISGFRYGIGVDYFNYERMYFRLTDNPDIIGDIVHTRYEPGWIVLNYLVKIIFDDVKYVFIISSLIIWTIHFKAIYNHRSKISIGIATLIIFSTLFNPSFNIIRLSVAASIVMLAVKPMLDKRPWKFLIIILFAGSFHYTSLVFLPAYWIVNSKNANVGLAKRTISVLLAVLLIILAQPIVSFITSFEIFSAYSHYQLTYGNFGIGMIVLKLPVIVIILLNLKKLKLSQNKIYQISILYFIGVILKFFGYLADYVGRIATYFEIMQVFILAAIVKVQTNKYEKLLYTTLIILYFLGWYTFEIIINNGHKTIPYMWIK